MFPWLGSPILGTPPAEAFVWLAGAIPTYIPTQGPYRLEASQIAAPGFIVASVFKPGSSKAEIFAPGSAAIQIGRTIE